MSQKETLILIIARHQLDPQLIPPFKIIIPMLNNLYPVRIFTSLDGQIKPENKSISLYDELVKKLQTNGGFCCLTKILQYIVKEYDQKKDCNYRVCIIGNQKVQWGTVMQFKRRNIVVDTVCGESQKSNLLIQISYITGGVHKTAKQSTLVRTFQSEISMNSRSRHNFKIDKKETVQFSVTCCFCNNQITTSFLACSVCLAVYCDSQIKCRSQRHCKNCGHAFD